MRRFAIGTMLVLGLAAVGCEKPVDGIPSSTGGASSGVSSGDDLSVQMPPAEAEKPVEAAPPATEDSAPPADPAKPADAPAGEEAKQSNAGKAGAAKFVADTSLKVPTMSCPHGCWPTVKDTLAAQPGVEAVELAKQSSDDAIDNPVVYIKLNGKFNSKAAVDALAKAGFENAEVVN